jgi:DNA-binding transcriptional MocR family regulator
MQPIRLTIQPTDAPGSPAVLEDALRLVPGVISVHAVPGGMELIVEAAASVRADDLIAAARKAGYIAVVAG